MHSRTLCCARSAVLVLGAKKFLHVVPCLGKSVTITWNRTCKNFLAPKSVIKNDDGTSSLPNAYTVIWQRRGVIWQRKPIINRDTVVLFHRFSLFKTHTDQQWNIRNISRNVLNPRADRQRRASCGEPKLASL